MRRWYIGDLEYFYTGYLVIASPPSLEAVCDGVVGVASIDHRLGSSGGGFLVPLPPSVHFEVDDIVHLEIIRGCSSSFDPDASLIAKVGSWRLIGPGLDHSNVGIHTGSFRGDSTTFLTSGQC